MVSSAVDLHLGQTSAYNGSNDEHANNRHQPIETSPPSCILITSFINRIKGILKISYHRCTADAADRVFFTGGFVNRARRQGEERGDEPG